MGGFERVALFVATRTLQGGGSSMEETQEKKAEKKRSFIVRLALWPLKGKGWRRWVRVTVAVLALYNLYACVAMRRPPVWGRVVEKETGKPIAGAEVYVQATCAIVGPHGLWGPRASGLGSAVTHQSGFFFIPGGSSFVCTPWWTFETSLVARSQEWVTCAAVREGSSFKGQVQQSGPHIRVQWMKIPIIGHLCLMQMAGATSEDEWKEKCDSTTKVKDWVPEDVAGRWLFDDLVGYLERWPEGEKAKDYYLQLWETANLVPCNPYEREDFGNGQLSREELNTYCQRAKKIIALAETFKGAPPGMTEESFRKSLDDEKRQLACGQELLAKAESERKGGAR